jgi:acyl-CoA synthetase (AMP-forming)/AMP-acid ligase II
VSGAERLNASTLLDRNLEAGRAGKTAFLTADGQVTYSEFASLTAWCKGNLRRYEYPHVVEFVEDLPRTPTGKVQRYKLRESEAVRTTLAGSQAAH